MAQSQGRRKKGQPIEMEFENVEIAEISAFQQRFVAREHDSELGLDHAVLIFVADSYHKRGFSVQGSNDDGITEHTARKNSPVMISTVLTMWPYSVCGYMWP